MIGIPNSNIYRYHEANHSSGFGRCTGSGSAALTASRELTWYAIYFAF